MKWTRANVAQDAKDEGLTQIEVDGIPDGFAWYKDGLKVGAHTSPAVYVAYLPLNSGGMVMAHSIGGLLKAYNEEKRYGK